MKLDRPVSQWQGESGVSFPYPMPASCGVNW